VVRYIGNGEPWSPERATEVSERLAEHWEAHGFGWRVAFEGPSAVGLIALNYLGEGTAGLSPEEFEIGWWLDPGAWGRGLATEGARAVRDEAFGRVGAASIVARLRVENLASAGVATKLGMSPEFDTTGRFGEPLRVYRGRYAPPSSAASSS
jgi:RimJ/RimL family protein N-acetyltransferase